MATAHDVSRLAGVSQSAVSRYFTGASVSTKTAARVEQAVQKLNYRPNSLARSLITGKSGIVALVVGYLENVFYFDALQKFSGALQDNSYHLLVFMLSTETENIDTIVEEMLAYQVEGVIMASVTASSTIAHCCHQQGIPVVLFNRIQDSPGVSSVSADNRAGGRAVADFLVAAGYQRIAYIAGDVGASTQQHREAGFVEGLTAAGKVLFAREEGHFDFKQSCIAVARMFQPLRAHQRPDAIFAANDHMAFAVMETLRTDLQLRVPEDVAVVGYDDVGLSSWPSFNLTTVHQPLQKMVDCTVGLLLQLIGDKNCQPQHIVLHGDLVVRNSTRKPGESPDGNE